MPSVKIYHNINRDANFGYNVVFDREGNHVARAPAERHELVLVFEYALPPDAIAAHRVICDLACEAFNIGTDELAQRYRARGLRSLSVGDVVMIDGDAYACDKAGWSPVSADDLRILPADEAERAIRKLFDFGPGESLHITVPLADTWACVDCGWALPFTGPPSEGAECDNCGGELGPGGELV